MEGFILWLIQLNVCGHWAHMYTHFDHISHLYKLIFLTFSQMVCFLNNLTSTSIFILIILQLNQIKLIALPYQWPFLVVYRVCAFLFFVLNHHVLSSGWKQIMYNSIIFCQSFSFFLVTSLVFLPFLLLCFLHLSADDIFLSISLSLYLSLSLTLTLTHKLCTLILFFYRQIVLIYMFSVFSNRISSFPFDYLWFVSPFLFKHFFKLGLFFFLFLPILN